MDFVSVRDLRINTGEVWEKLEKEKELVVTSNGKPVAVMAGITGRNLETILAAVRRARGEWALREIRKESLSRGLDRIQGEEIEEEIRKARKGRPK
jgi:prevent-host-death family protein